MIYLDNAATTGKKPEAVINAVKYSLYNLCANPGRSGHKAAQKVAEAVYDARKNIAQFFGCDEPESVIFTQNCTQAVNIVLKGATERGDKILVSDMEHNAVMRPLTEMGADYKMIDVSLYDDNETVKRFADAIDERAKMIFVCAASNVTGKCLPLKEIGKLAHSKGILFGVDAAQAAGVIPIDMNEMNIDFLCIAAHKGLYAPMGTGILIARKPLSRTIIEGGTGTESLNFSQPLTIPEGFESGTVNVPGIVGINAGISFLKGLKRDIYADELQAIKKLYEFLSVTDGAVLYTPYPEKEHYAPVLSFNVEGVNSQIAADELNRSGIAVRAGFHCAPTAHRKIGTENMGAVRVSPSIYTTAREIMQFERAFKKICENRKKYVD